MKSINISNRDLDAFLALADTQHFSRAAELSNLSQSAFSQKIVRIEQMMQVALVERSTRHVTLTPEGEFFAEEARRIRQDLVLAVEQLHELATLRKGRVAVAALPSVAAAWMPQVIRRYRDLYPSIQIELFDTVAEGALNLLRKGQVDMAIAAGVDLREFDVTQLMSEPFYLVCPRGHPLASRKYLSLTQLRNEELIHMVSSSSVRQHLEMAGLIFKPGSLEVKHLATIAALVKQGLGLTIVPAATLFHFKCQDLTAVRVKDAKLSRPMYLAQRKGSALSTAAKAMVKEIMSVSLSATINANLL